MKLLTILWFLGSIRPIPAPPEPPITNREQLIERIEKKFIGTDYDIAMGVRRPSNAPKTDWITPEYRPIVIDYLKNKARDPKYLERSLRVLVALNDEETMKDVLRQYNDGTLIDDTILMMNLHPEQIKDLVPIIYSGSDVPRKVIDSQILKSPRIYAVYSIVDFLTWGPVFPDETMRWASGLNGNIHNYENQKHDNQNEPHIMWLFQQWWEHNKTAILEERYADATWVPKYKGQIDYYDKKQREEQGYLNYTSTTRNDILPIPKTADIRLPSRPVPVLENVSASNTGNLIIYSVLGFTICVVFAVWLVKRIKPTGG